MYECCTYEEVNAMRQLNDNPFTLMTMLRNDDINPQSEDVYYEMFLEPYFEKNKLEDNFNWEQWAELESYNHDIVYFVDKNYQKQSHNRYTKNKNYKSKTMKQFNTFRSDLLYGYPYSFIRRTDDNDKEYFTREYRGKSSKKLKQQYHRKVRRNRLYKYQKGNNCKKQFDFWWKLI